MSFDIRFSRSFLKLVTVRSVLILFFLAYFMVSSFIFVSVSSRRLGVEICRLFCRSSSLVGSSDRSVAMVLLSVSVLSCVFQLGTVVLIVSSSSWRAIRVLKRLNCSSDFCVLFVAS